LIADKRETRLAVQYESLRRREYELITHLLEVLPGIDGLDESRLVQMRDALFHADHPFLWVFVGPFSSGKSSLINALTGQPDLLPVGPTPTTDTIVMLRYGDQPQRLRVGETETVFSPSPLLHKVSFVDTPGLESIFQTHEAMTRQFLHRADAVLLVMLATQAMTARNLEYLRILKDYGKTVIIAINQVDLLSDEEAATVRQYVLDQSGDLLGYRPDVWMLSARRGLAARQPDGTIDPDQWVASGLEQVERYIDEQLNDAARLRQKLQTPIQIAHGVHEAALAAVRGNQAAIDQYQGIAKNVEGQLEAYQREQERAVRDHVVEAVEKFELTAERGRDAMVSIFQFNQVIRLIGGGFSEMLGLAGLVRRAQRSTLYVRPAFEAGRVYEPLDRLPDAVDKLAPRLEGKDVEDTEALITYARREIEGLPAPIRGKVIGALQPPQRYDRSALANVRSELDAIESTARLPEMERTETAIRNTLMYASTWLALALILIVFVWFSSPTLADGTAVELPLLVLLLIVAVFGVMWLLVRGYGLGADYERRLKAHGIRYGEALTRAAGKQVAYGMQMRRAAVAPLTRLVETQTQTQTAQMKTLQTAQQSITTIEAELARMAAR